MSDEYKKQRLVISKTLRGMKYRCNNKNYYDYHRYGGRGIKVCEEWSDNTESFIQWSLDNGYQEGLSIDRIDNNGNYEPSNCRWTTMKEQQNNRSNNIVLEYNGEYRGLREWSEILELDYEIIKDRYYKGWSPTDILERRKDSHFRTLTLHGETKLLTEWSKILGINKGTLWYRYEHGWSDDHIIDSPYVRQSKKSKIFLTYNEETLSIYDWSKKTGTVIGTMYNRYYKGWKPEEIIYGKKDVKKAIYIKYDNKTLSLREWSYEVGLHQDTLRKRYNKGWSSEEILFGKTI